MKVVLVMLNNMQSYIFDNIQHLINHNNDDIVLIIDKKYNSLFKDAKVNIVNIEDLISDYSKFITNIDTTFRNGFWQLTSYRFTALYEYMKKTNTRNIVHLENDVLIYKDINTIKFHDMDKLLLTMDSKNRCIPGIMYIPSHEVIKKCLDNFNPKLNDMQNFSLCYYKFKEDIDTLPIFTECDNSEVAMMISKNFRHYNAIFDAAAIGQYLGGIDPRNKSGDTRFFVNETCVINYSKNNFIWKNENGKKYPYIVINNIEYPIINLHIHCKDLKQFID